MNTAVANLHSTMVFALALAAGMVTSIACAATPAESEIAVKTAVKYADLKLDTPAGATQLYSRLKAASNDACRRLESTIVHMPKSHDECVETALGHAVHDFGRNSLARVYLRDHSSQIAAKYGIEETIRAATK
jgi:UrcA family protein